MTAVGRAGVAGAVSVLLLAGSARPTQGALGQAQASVETDRRHLKASVQTTLGTGYAVHEMTLPMGTTVKEFSSRTGLVFGVAWAGPRLPDLRQLLGSYFDTYVQAARQRRGRRGPLLLRLPGLIVESYGHPRGFHGRAYLPELLPGGVNADVVQ